MNQKNLPLILKDKEHYQEQIRFLDNVSTQKEIVAQTPYSLVIKITTHMGIFFLKKTPPGLFLESKILNYLKPYHLSIPEIVLSSKEESSFLLKSCGDETIRTAHKNQFDSTILLKGIENYRRIQKISESSIGELINLGVLDWRLERFPYLYQELIQDQNLFERLKISKEDQQNLYRLESIMITLCEDIQNIGIKDSINHLDFQENNMMINYQDNIISIIDWGEVAIGNPLFSIINFTENFTKRNPNLIGLIQLTESVTLDFFSSKEQQNYTIDKIKKLLPIYYIMTLLNLESKIGQSIRKLDQRILDSFKYFLRLNSQSY